MNPDVIDVEPMEDYRLRLVFEGGEIRIFDLKPYLEFGIFSELKRREYFKSAFVEFGSVEWPGGQGLSFDTLYEKSIPVKLEIAA